MTDDTQAQEEYELISHKDLRELKQKLDDLKNSSMPISEKDKGDLKSSVDALTISINKLLDLFREANLQIKKNESEVNAKIDPLISKMDEILDQNKKLAKGIVAVADVIEDFKKQNMQNPRPSFNNFQQPSSQNLNFNPQFNDSQNQNPVQQFSQPQIPPIGPSFNPGQFQAKPNFEIPPPQFGQQQPQQGLNKQPNFPNLPPIQPNNLPPLNQPGGQSSQSQFNIPPPPGLFDLPKKDEKKGFGFFKK